MNLTFFVLSDNTSGDYTFLNKFAGQLSEHNNYKITFIVTKENLHYPDKDFSKVTWNPQILLDNTSIDNFYKQIKSLNTDVLITSGLPQPHGAYNHYYLLDLFHNDGIRILNFMYDNSPWNIGSFTFLKSTYANYPLEFVYTCPIATPSPAAIKDVHFWCSYPEKAFISKENKKSTKVKFNVPEKESLIFMSVSNWTNMFPMADAYYDIFFQTLTESLSVAKNRTHLIVINKGNTLNNLKGNYGLCSFIPMELLDKNDYENLLLSSDLVISDNARQSSMVKANSAFIPTLLLKNETVFEKELSSFKSKNHADKMKNDKFYSFSRSLKNIENIVKNESYYELLNTADLFDNELTENIHRLINGSLKYEIMEKQKRYFLNLLSLPNAHQIILNKNTTF